jgi:hypothetical protein
LPRQLVRPGPSHHIKLNQSIEKTNESHRKEQNRPPPTPLSSKRSTGGWKTTSRSDPSSASHALAIPEVDPKVENWQKNPEYQQEDGPSGH